MSGYALYVLFAGFAVVFWRAWAGRLMDQIFAASGDHHHVLAVLAKHPKGRYLGRVRALDGRSRASLSPLTRSSAPISAGRSRADAT